MDHTKEMYFRYMEKSYRVYKSDHNNRMQDICNSHYPLESHLKYETLGFSGNTTFMIFSNQSNPSILNCPLSEFGKYYLILKISKFFFKYNFFFRYLQDKNNIAFGERCSFKGHYTSPNYFGKVWNFRRLR